MHGQQKLDSVCGNNQIKAEAIKLGGGFREQGQILEDLWGGVKMSKLHHMHVGNSQRTNKLFYHIKMMTVRQQ